MVGWVLAAWMGTASAQQGVDEIIVYGDDFARWDDTRWLVEAELVVPTGVFFARDFNYGFNSFAFQVRAVLACEKDYEPKKNRPKRLDVTCDIEDIAILASSQRRYKSERDREIVQQVLDEIDAKLTGVRVQLQTDFKGGVNNLDIEGITTTNNRQREAQEALRQVVMRLMAGYHLKIPDHAQRAGQWIEYGSELMEMPSLTSSRGSTTLVHVVSPYDAYQLVQTVGEGTVSVNVPAPRTESTRESLDDGGSVTGGGGGVSLDRGGGGAAPPSMGGIDVPGVPNGGGDVLDIELTYTLDATGVALFERDTGILTERVWAVQGMATASSGGGGLVSSPPFRNVGRLRILGEKENPDVGPSKQVAPPGTAREGLDPWVPLEVTPEAQ